MTWLPAVPEEWPDQMNGFDSDASLRIEAVMKPDEECNHVVNFRFENGRVVDNKACRILGQNRIRYSDGLTRLGWPSVVVDGPDGRGVYIANNEDALRRIMNAGYRVKILGNPSQPTWIWVNLN